MYAYITLDARYLVGADSTCTIGDTTVPLPESGPYAPDRIIAAIRCLGFQPDGDYFSALTRVQGGCQIKVKGA